MHHYYTERARSIARRPCTGLLLLLLATFALPSAAAVSAAAAPLPALAGLRPAEEVDLMEVAFREGVERYQAGDYSAAVRAWETPARRGHAGAQFSLGVAHATGHGVPQSLERAIEWWEVAAAAGHVSAQLNLGLLYWRGEGVEKNLTKAREWWRLAAEGGDPAAQFHLGAMAAIGEGVPLNYPEAARWWRRAAAQGYEQAIKGLEILRRSGVPLDE